MKSESSEAPYDRHAQEIDGILTEEGSSQGFSWSLVRVLGDLEVLTRASYVMLVVVPLLAGTWPAVTIVVNRYNGSIKAAAERLDVAADRLELHLQNHGGLLDDSDVVGGLIEGLRRDVSLLSDDLEATTLESLYLPGIWVWAFLAALATVLGHTVYQLAAPQLVRRSSEREHISERIEEELRIMPEPGGSDEYSYQANTLSKERWKEIVLDARRQYVYSAKSRILGATVSAGLYLCAIWMIAVVVWKQTSNVLSAAGWIGII